MTVLEFSTSTPLIAVKTMSVEYDWFTAEARVIASVKLGIEQLKKGLGTFLTDADLEDDGE